MRASGICSAARASGRPSTTRVATSEESITSRIDHIAAVAVIVNAAETNATIPGEGCGCGFGFGLELGLGLGLGLGCGCGCGCGFGFGFGFGLGVRELW